MAVVFNKPKGLKYTDMCIYIDAHLKDIVVPNANPDVESKIYEYLYHIAYALAYKAGYFRNFADYDAFACYAAAELFISMRKKQMNAGQVVRGKVVIPVKSCLNFLKATLFPLKVNYQRESFSAVFDPKLHPEIAELDDQCKEAVKIEYSADLQEAYDTAIKKLPLIIKDIVYKSFFKNDPVMCQRLYMSLLLTLLNDTTLPNRIKCKIVDKEDNLMTNKQMTRNTIAYIKLSEPALVWHLDERMKNYVRVLSVKIKKKFSEDMHYYIHSNDLSDELLDMVVKSAYNTREEITDGE